MLEHVLAIAGAEFELTQKANEIGMQVVDAQLEAGLLPASRMLTSTSFCALVTNSSMRAGWMRPSVTSLERAIRAISRRMGRRPERVTESGESSTMISTPGDLFESPDIAGPPAR